MCVADWQALGDLDLVQSTLANYRQALQNTQRNYPHDVEWIEHLSAQVAKGEARAQELQEEREQLTQQLREQREALARKRLERAKPVAEPERELAVA